jgi:outer membrane receptor protein involved in Fe transport
MTSSEIGRNWTNDNGVYSYYNSDGNSLRKHNQVGLRGNVAYDFGDEKILSIGGRYNYREGNEGSVLNYYEWTSLALDKKFYNSVNNGVRDGGEYQLNASYNHPFDKNGHELLIELDFENEDGNDVTTNNLFSLGKLIDGKTTSEKGPGNEFTSKIDYQLPLSEDSKFEAGYQGELQLSNEVTELDIYNPLSNTFEKNPLFMNDIKYYTNQYAIYSMYSNKIDELGVKFGLRSEYTGREVKIEAKNQNYSIDKWDFFPTAHFSFNFGSGNQLMTSYTRRINRPHGWEFEPFLTWIDAYNVRIGNPSILPEYIDSYELGFQKIIGNSLFSVDSYYRVTNNKIDRIRSFYSENVTIQTPQNIGKDYALGTELFVNFDPIEKWNVNLMGNLYDYKIKGQLNSTNFDRSSFNWNVRFNNTVKLSQETMIQLNLMYNSPTVSSQGKREGYLSTNLAVKQTFFNKMLTATLQVRDLFSAASNEAVNESFDFYNYRYSERESPVVMLNLRFNFNNFKERDGGDGMENNNEE